MFDFIQGFSFLRKEKNKVPLLFIPNKEKQLQPINKQINIYNTRDVYEIFWNNWNYTMRFREELMVLFLSTLPCDKGYSVLGLSLEAIGDKNQVVSRAYTKIERAKKIGASAIVVAHNHTTYDARPSNNDLEIFTNTRKRLLHEKIEYYDELILTPKNNRYFSYKEKGLL